MPLPTPAPLPVVAIPAVATAPAIAAHAAKPPPPAHAHFGPLPALKNTVLCGVGTAQPSHYLKGIRLHRNSVMYRGAMLNIHKYKLHASSCPDIFRNSMTTIAQEQEEHWWSELMTLLTGMVDFTLFREMHFLLFQMSTVLLFTWFVVPYFYLADYMTSTGLYSEREASIVLSVIGVTNTIGIILLGWAGDQPWVDVKKTYAGCLIMCGISAWVLPACISSYVALCIVSGLFGLFFASSFSFTPIILMQLVSLEKFTTSYGLVLLCQGIGNLVGPPVAGGLYDITQTWEPSFYLTGFWIVVSGLLIGAIPMTKNHIMCGCGISDKEKEAEQVACA